MRSSQIPIRHMKTSLRLTPLTLSSRVLGYGTRAHPLGLNLMSTYSLGHQSSDFDYATSLLGKPKTQKTHFQLGEAKLLSSSLHKSLSKLERKLLARICSKIVLRRIVRRYWSRSPMNSAIYPLVSSSPSLSSILTFWIIGRLCVLERRAVHDVSATHQVKLGDPQDSISCFFQLYFLRFSPKYPCFHKNIKYMKLQHFNQGASNSTVQD
ncbi:hypothetical protein H5410_030656 [Solanum commersonii]|uniref:Uncharacterized protein n=1 Tax=Solanum commersonii TaxID=4109 RepID=A0A9J5YK02_SOLCO|nr:hypothetical protein H5410_030656 [Solanum commersonii]